MGLLQDFLPSQEAAPPVQQAPAESGSVFDDLVEGLGNSGMMELISGGAMLNNVVPPPSSQHADEPSRVQQIIDEKYAHNKDMTSPGPWEMAHSEALGDRSSKDPNNQDEDLAAAEHYLWGRASADQTARKVGGPLGHLAAMGDGLATGLLAVGYEGYKTAGYAMKDHNMLLGGAMAATGVGLLPGLAMMAFGDDAGEGMLKAISANDKLPSKPSLKSLGWGLKGSGDAISDHFWQLVGG